MIDSKKDPSMANSAFFCNEECEYYPCHRDLKEINCLFCYCPLFWDCPFQNGGAKSKGLECPDCTYAHKRENYAHVMQLIRNTYDKKLNPDAPDGVI
jgi:precorrin-2/cobalt-factor-2 C20-methyltransferase